MSEEAKFISGSDRVSQLAKRPDIAAGVAQIRADMADRSYAVDPVGIAEPPA